MLQRSIDVLPNGELLQENAVQDMLDKVYPEIEVGSIDYSGAIFIDSEWQLKKLRHVGKSALLDVLDIDSAICITESDRIEYENGLSLDKIKLEIPVSYKSVGYKKLDQSPKGHHPYIVPDKAYSEEMGLLMDYANPEHYKTFEIL